MGKAHHPEFEGKMNRRSFLKRLGIGVATTAAVAVAPEYCNSLCSSWCTEHAAPPVVATIGGYAEYCNFSSVALAEAIDKHVAEAAAELGLRAGKSVQELYMQTIDGYEPKAFGKNW